MGGAIDPFRPIGQSGHSVARRRSRPGPVAVVAPGAGPGVLTSPMSRRIAQRIVGSAVVVLATERVGIGVTSGPDGRDDSHGGVG